MSGAQAKVGRMRECAVQHGGPEHRDAEFGSDTDRWHKIPFT